jgi:hypothetical protein
MKRLMTAIALTIGLGGAVLIGAHAVAAPPTSQSALMKRQINDCMTRRMGSNRTLSYKDAMRACKERIQLPKEALASIGTSESGTKTH